MNFKKKIGKVFTSKFVGTGPSSYKKRIYRAAVSQRLRNTALNNKRDGLWTMEYTEGWIGGPGVHRASESFIFSHWCLSSFAADAIYCWQNYSAAHLQKIMCYSLCTTSLV